MPARKGLLAPQNTFLDTIATRFDGTHSNFVLGNAKITKIYPIVYCSDGFCELTGYSRAQIMQKSCACNFLYGQKTDAHHRDAIASALESKQELKLEVILYRSSGVPFWCLLDIVPIQDEKHEVVLFLCSHKDITKQKFHEQQQKHAAAAALLHQQQQQQQQLTTNNTTDLQQHVNVADNNNSHADCDGELALRQHAQTTTTTTAIAANATNTAEQHTTLAIDGAQTSGACADNDQQALISLDEFCLDEMDAGDDDDSEQDDEPHDKHTANQYSRRRSRAVLYQLSGHYGYRRSVNMKSKLKLNNRMTIPEYKTTTIEKQRFILSHYGLGKSCWDWLILIVSFYVAIVVPYNATFKDKSAASSSSSMPPPSHLASEQEQLAYDQDHECRIDSIDIFVEVVFIIDVILNFRTTFVNRKGEVVTRPKIICKHYVRGWFIVDACAALPFDLLCGLNLYSRSRLKVDLNLLKLIRLLRLARLLQKMDRYSQYSYIILTLLMLIFSLLAHWCACIWYVIAMEEIERHPAEWKLGWIHQLSDKLGYNIVNSTDMASSYVTALYFTTSSLTSVGFGNVSANTNAEKIFSIVIMLIGALMHAVVFGNVTALIRVMYARRSNYQTRLRDLKDFFRLHQLPKDLQQRMSDYFQTTWSLNHGIDSNEILKDFPEELRGDVSLHLHREVLSLPIFASAPQGFLKSLARHIESKFCCPTEYLIHRGDALGYLYLVCNGSMEVLQDNMVVGILGKGDLVGYDVNSSLLLSSSCNGGTSTSVPPPPPLTNSTSAQHLMASSTQSVQLASANAALGSGGGGGAAATNAASKSLSAAIQQRLVKSSSDLKALTYCDLKCIHIGGLLDTLKLYPEFADTFHDEIIHDLSFNLREQHEEQAEEEEEEDDDDDVEGEEEEEDDDNDDDDDEEDDEEAEEEEEQEEQEDDDDDNDDDDDDDDGKQSNAGPPSGRRQMRRRLSPAPPGCEQAQPMGRLLQSITTSQQDGASVSASHRIGRYDHEESDDENENNQIVTDDDDDDAEDEERDEDDENIDITNKRRLHNTNHDDDSGNEGHVNGQVQQAASSALLASGTKQPNDSDKRQHKISEQRAVGKAQERSATGQHNKKIMAYRAGSDASARWNQQNSDVEPRKQMDANGRSSIVSNDDKDDRRQSANNQQRRLKSAINLPGCAPRAYKPPISFDLSRNTTALVDRRRRSAGCIQRLALATSHSSDSSRAQNVANPTSGRVLVQTSHNNKKCHSSLIHISEEEPMMTMSWGIRRQVARDNGVRISRRKSVETSSGGGSTLMNNKQQNRCEQASSASSNKQQQQHHMRASYSSQDLAQIDEHITASVRQLRLEFKQELSYAMESLARLVMRHERKQAAHEAAEKWCQDDRLYGALSAGSLIAGGQQTTTSGYLNKQMRTRHKELAEEVASQATTSAKLKGRVAPPLTTSEQNTMLRSVSSASLTRHATFNKPTGVSAVCSSGQVNECPVSSSSSSSSLLSRRVVGNASKQQEAVEIESRNSSQNKLTRVSAQYESRSLSTASCEDDDDGDALRAGNAPAATSAAKLPSSPPGTTTTTTTTTTNCHQNVSMLNVSDNDSGRSTSSVNSSFGLTPAVCTTSLVSAQQRRWTGQQARVLLATPLEGGTFVEQQQQGNNNVSRQDCYKIDISDSPTKNESAKGKKIDSCDRGEAP